MSSASRGAKKENVLVTGGAGYVGSHTCKHLANSGFYPVTYDNLSTGNTSAVRWGPLEVGDIGDTARVFEVLSQYEISAVIHFAASAYVGESVANPRKYFDNNFVKSVSLLNTLLDHDIRDFVFSSTCATYGIPEQLPITESHPQNPINPYGESKLAVERALPWYAHAYGLRWTSLRYFNAAGADPDGEIGESHAEETHLIPLAIAASVPGNQPLRVFGSDYPTADGTPVRDYIHVADLAKAHALALLALRDGMQSRAYNLGSGRGRSVKEVVDTIEQVTNKIPATIHFERRPGDPAVLIADASLARRELGWMPDHSDLTEIVATAWAWFERQTSSAQVERSEAASAF